jgi:hypothetical protein
MPRSSWWLVEARPPLARFGPERLGSSLSSRALSRSSRASCSFWKGDNGDAALPMRVSQRPFACRKASALLRLYGTLYPELLGEPDEKSFGSADVAEPIRVLVLNHFADELRATLAEPGERLVDVVHGEHDA